MPSNKPSATYGHKSRKTRKRTELKSREFLRSHLFFANPSFLFLMPCPPHPFRGQFSSRKSPLSGSSRSTLSGREKATCRGWVLETVLDGVAPQEKKEDPFFSRARKVSQELEPKVNTVKRGKLFYLQLEFFFLQSSFFAYSPLRPLLDALFHCKQKSSNCK